MRHPEQNFSITVEGTRRLVVRTAEEPAASSTPKSRKGYGDLKTELRALTTQCNALKEEIASLQATVASSKETIGALEAENRTLKTALDTSTQSKSILETDNARLTRELTFLKKINSDLSEDMVGVKSRYTGEVMRLRAENERLKSISISTASSVSASPSISRPGRPPAPPVTTPSATLRTSGMFASSKYAPLTEPSTDIDAEGFKKVGYASRRSSNLHTRSVEDFPALGMAAKTPR